MRSYVIRECVISTYPLNPFERSLPSPTHNQAKGSPDLIPAFEMYNKSQKHSSVPCHGYEFSLLARMRIGLHAVADFAKRSRPDSDYLLG